jgi:hypothetical protein
MEHFLRDFSLSYSHVHENSRDILHANSPKLSIKVIFVIKGTEKMFGTEFHEFLIGAHSIGRERSGKM